MQDLRDLVCLIPMVVLKSSVRPLRSLILLRQLSYILFMTLYILPPIPSLNSFNSKYSLGTRSNAFPKSTKKQYNLHFWLLTYLLINDFRIQIWSTRLWCFLYALCRSQITQFAIPFYILHNTVFNNAVLINNFPTQLATVIPL